MENNLIKNIIYKDSIDGRYKICFYEKCEHKFLNGKFHINNARKHIKSHHGSIYSKKLKEELLKYEKSNLRSYKMMKRRRKNYQNEEIITIPSFEISTKDLKNWIINMFSIEGSPFSIADSLNFKMLLKCYTDALKIEINSKRIKDWILEEATTKKREIIEYIKGKKVSIKFDTSSKYRKSYLSVNVQFFYNNLVVLFNLAVKRYIIRSTSENIKGIVRNILNSFEIKDDQIIYIVIDNGRNMIKAAKEFHNHKNEEHMLEDFTENGSNIDESLTENKYDETDDFYNEEENKEIHYKLSDIFSGTKIHIIRCGAHTLQLYIKDFYEAVV